MRTQVRAVVPGGHAAGAMLLEGQVEGAMGVRAANPAAGATEPAIAELGELEVSGVGDPECGVSQMVGEVALPGVASGLEPDEAAIGGRHDPKRQSRLEKK